MTVSQRPALLGGRPLAAQPLPIVRPRFPALAEIADDLEQALATGHVTNHGPHVQRFEQRLADMLGVSAVAATNCGQSAVMLLLRAAGVTGGEVIVPALTFSATPHAVAWCGATPVFADVEPGGFGLDPRDAERCITDRTTAILAVDPYGIPCDREALVALGEAHGVPVLFDAAPAFGARWDGRPIGGEGDGSAFSFHATKAFSTTEGGCVSAPAGSTLVARVAVLRNFAQVRGADCDEPGMNAKMTEFAALLGLAQVDDVTRRIDHRNAIAVRYRAALAAVPGLRTAAPPSRATPAWLYYPILVDPTTFGLNRDELVAGLAAERIQARTYYSPACHLLRCYAQPRQRPLPQAEDVAARVVALPVYNDMTVEECDTITAAIRRLHEHAPDVRARLAAIATPPGPSLDPDPDPSPGPDPETAGGVARSTS